MQKLLVVQAQLNSEKKRMVHRNFEFVLTSTVFVCTLVSPQNTVSHHVHVYALTIILLSIKTMILLFIYCRGDRGRRKYNNYSRFCTLLPKIPQMVFRDNIAACESHQHAMNNLQPIQITAATVACVPPPAMCLFLVFIMCALALVV